MRELFDFNRVRLYLWIALAFLSLWLCSEIVNNPDTFFERAVNNLWRLLFVLILNYTLFEYSVPQVLRTREWIVYNVLIGLLVAFIYMMLYSFGLLHWRRLGIALHIYTPLKTITTDSHGASEQMSYSVGSVFFFGVIRHIYYYIKLKQAAQKLRIEKQEAELNFLKSQTNPHFLFNTLNNIYSLSRDKSDLAPESILRLSKILRFMLYETSGAFIAIEQELKIINDFIALEKLRYDESLRVNFNYDVEDMKQAIPPLLLVPLVENAFKHGAAETRGHAFIDIHLSVNNRKLVFVVKNSSEAEGRTDVKENIGLSNLRRQLELLYKEYELSVRREQSEFIATLKINLASHV